MSDDGLNNTDKSCGDVNYETSLNRRRGGETFAIEDLAFDQFTESGSFDLRCFQLTSIGRLLDALPLMALLVDSHHRIIFANELSFNLAGEHRQVTGNIFTSIFPRVQDAAKANETLKTVFLERKLRVGEGAMELGDTRMWGRLNFRPIRLGKKRFVLVLVEDLTFEKKHLLMIERHKALFCQTREKFEKELQQQVDELRNEKERLEKEIAERAKAQQSIELSKEGFRNIVDRTRQGIIILDLGETVVYANSSAARMFGQTTDVVVGERLSLRLVPGQAVELDIIRPSGGNGVAEVRVERTEWNGKPAYLVVIHDITDMKQSECQLLRAQKLESLELIAGGVAHDFNNLLTANVANISLAKMRTKQDSPIYEALIRAEKAAHKAKDLTRQLLTFTKGKILVKRPTSIRPLIEDCVSLSLGGSNVKSELDIPEDLWAVDAEPSQLGMLFQNLLINACQAMPRGGTISIQAENVVVNYPTGREEHSASRSKFIRISLQDSGAGVTTENLSKIFEPYFTTKPNGSGLGLTTAHSIVQSHGGRIEIKSRVGHGTCFYIYLPASEYAAETVQRVVDLPPISGSGRILVMDDEEDIREVTVSLLQQLGYQAESACGGVEAIEKYRSGKFSGKPFDVVIVDLVVPGGMGGKATIERLRSFDPGVKVILSTGNEIDEVVSNYRLHGFKGLIRKPYTTEEIASALHSVLEDERKKSKELEERR